MAALALRLLHAANTASSKAEDCLAMRIYSGSQTTAVSFIGLYAIAQTDERLFCEHEALLALPYRCRIPVLLNLDDDFQQFPRELA